MRGMTANGEMRIVYVSAQELILHSGAVRVV